MHQPPPSHPGGYGPPPQSGYGPPQGYAPQGYGPPQHGYGPGSPPPKKGMSTGMIALVVFGCLFGGCVMCSAVGSAGKKGSTATAPSAAPLDPAAAAAKRAAEERASEEAKAAKEKSAVETFPAKKADLAASLTKAKAATDARKWSQANDELTPTEKLLSTFKGTSVAESKEFQQLDDKAFDLRKKLAPQLEKEAKAAALAAEESELRASSVVVSNARLFDDYQSNEVAADAMYKGKKLLVTGTVASIDKGPFGGLILRLATSNPFMSTMADMERSEQSQMAQLQKGERVRVLCKGRGTVLGSPSLDDCVFK